VCLAISERCRKTYDQRVEISSEEKKRRGAGFGGARACSRGPWRGGGAAPGDDEIIGDDEDDTDSDDDAGDASDDEGPTGSGVAQSALDAHFTNLDGVKVTELRARLRAKQNPTSVVEADLPSSTPAIGAAKSAAILLVLRKRLAGVLAAEEPGRT